MKFSTPISLFSLKQSVVNCSVELINISKIFSLALAITLILISAFYYSINSSHKRAENYYGPLSDQYRNVAKMEYHLAPLTIEDDSKTIKTSKFSSFNFNNIAPYSEKLNVNYLSSIDKNLLKESLISSMPQTLRFRASKYIDDILLFSEMNRLDPLWVLSIVWTESHFRPRAQSNVSAQGLMQIMPATGVFINELLDRPSNERLVMELLKDPRTNIELGTFYLKRLFERFDSHMHATVAYNMGPRFVRNSINKKLPLGVKNHYLNKVNRHYKKMLNSIIALENLSREDGLENLLTYRPALKKTDYFVGLDLISLIHPRFAIN